MYTCILDGGISDGVKGSNRAVNANEEEEINSRFDGWLRLCQISSSFKPSGN